MSIFLRGESDKEETGDCYTNLHQRKIGAMRMTRHKYLYSSRIWIVVLFKPQFSLREARPMAIVIAAYSKCKESGVIFLQIRWKYFADYREFMIRKF